mgnify:CR=1 FL=1
MLINLNYIWIKNLKKKGMIFVLNTNKCSEVAIVANGEVYEE